MAEIEIDLLCGLGNRMANRPVSGINMTPKEELAGLRQLLKALESRKMTLRENGKDVTQREIGKLHPDINFLEKILARTRRKVTAKAQRMSINVTYSTEAFLHKNKNQAGMLCERLFSSIEEAKNSSLPEGFVSAFIRVENGYHVYSPKLGWEFHEAEK